MAHVPSRCWASSRSRSAAPTRRGCRSSGSTMLGLELTGNFRSERENVDEDICAIGSGPFKVEVDLMQPLDPDKKPAVHATPLNHVGLWIDDLPRAVEWLTAQRRALRAGRHPQGRGRIRHLLPASEGQRRVPDRAARAC